jgi:hypothetical protein
MPFLIRRDGAWLYQGSPIDRKELVCLFASVLTRDKDGDYLLQTPVECGRITVEDAPFVAVELDWVICRGQQLLSFRLNTDRVVTAGPSHPIHIKRDPQTGEGVPYLLVCCGHGDFPLEARICRAVYYELVALAVPQVVDGVETLGVWSSGSFFPLGELAAQDWLADDRLSEDRLADDWPGAA